MRSVPWPVCPAPGPQVPRQVCPAPGPPVPRPVSPASPLGGAVSPASPMGGAVSPASPLGGADVPTGSWGQTYLQRSRHPPERWHLWHSRRPPEGRRLRRPRSPPEGQHLRCPRHPPDGATPAAFPPSSWASSPEAVQLPPWALSARAFWPPSTQTLGPCFFRDSFQNNKLHGHFLKKHALNILALHQKTQKIWISICFSKNCTWSINRCFYSQQIVLTPKPFIRWSLSCLCCQWNVFILLNVFVFLANVKCHPSFLLCCFWAGDLTFQSLYHFTGEDLIGISCHLLLNLCWHTPALDCPSLICSSGLCWAILHRVKVLPDLLGPRNRSLQLYLLLFLLFSAKTEWGAKTVKGRATKLGSYVSMVPHYSGTCNNNNNNNTFYLSCTLHFKQNLKVLWRVSVRWWRYCTMIYILVHNLWTVESRIKKKIP